MTDLVTRIALRETPTMWYVAMAVSLSLLSLLIVTVGYLLTTGVGVWGNNNTVSWGFPIVNFVFWVGIGHAGTLISAILFLLRQNWRTGINRFAEAMTIFAVCCAAIFPGLHVGRIWFAYWLLPYPNELAMWPQSRSPLLWDVFAVGTYATVSLLFWYMGMIPDLATLRDRSTGRFAQMVYGVFSMGWTGSSRHWMRFERAYLLLAALATPLVLSVHSVVSFDFATSQIPGWHTTIFPPYFVAGAVFGGFAMVLTLSIPSREWFGLRDLITHRHIENMAKVMLGTGMIVAYAYSVEFFTAWYSQQHYEQFVFLNRPFGPYAWAFWTMVTCNVIAAPVDLVSLDEKERLGDLCRGDLCQRWHVVRAIRDCRHLVARGFSALELGDVQADLGRLGNVCGQLWIVFYSFFVVLRFLPMVAIAEVKTVMPQAHGDGHPVVFDFQPSEDTPAELRRGHWFT